MSFEPKFQPTAHLLKMIEEITALKTRIESSTINVAWLSPLIKETRAREAHSSTAIEGNPLTLEEVKILADGKPLPQAKPRHIQEILNYFAALRFLSQQTGKKEILEKDVLKLHKILGEGNALDRGPFGVYRNYEVRVGFHHPPPPNQVPRLMKDLLDWLNGPVQSWSPVISSAILHYQFEWIHPFGDGNGRVGRVLATWELYRRQFDTHHIFAVDEIFWENRQRYYQAFQQVAEQKEELSGWVEYIAESIAIALEKTWERIQTLGISKKGISLFLTPKQERLLRLLRENPMGIQEIQKILKVTRSGAHYILKPLLENKIVGRHGGHKTGKYWIL